MSKPTFSKPRICDTGMDLVTKKLEEFGLRASAISAVTKKAIIHADRLAIRVFTNLKPKPAGGRGKDILEWWIPYDYADSDFVALVDLSKERIWLFHKNDIPSVAQQRPLKGFHICMYTDHSANVTRAKFDYEFDEYLLDERVSMLRQPE